ncbi:protein DETOXIFICATION 23-like isoform X2 [Tasmannia lanceolata]|uniref:protein DETOXIFICATION 23-like isoform X2 n=1 Tax=Tasmannia lanceolata TaxID=3420 RepID=UPI004063B0BD
MESSVDETLLPSEKGEGEDLKGRIWSESKKLWRVAGPSILTRLSLFGMFVVTQAFMGHIGEIELAAYALVQTILLRFANGILLGMGSALETFCGQSFGAKQYHMMGIYMQRSWIILLSTAVLILPLYIFATPLFKLLREDDDLAEAAGKIALWFIPINFYFVFNFTMQVFLQTQLKNSIIAWLAAISFTLHILLSWIFVYKLNLGVSGAMGSMVLSTWLTIAGEFVYVFGGWCPLTWKGFSKSAFSELWPVVKLSVSSGVMICLELWYNSVLILVAGYMKNATIAISAFSICLNITAWELMISIGFLSATSVRVATELGRGDAKAAKFAVKVVSVTSLSIGVVFFVLFLALGNAISYAFSSSVEVAKAVSGLSVFLSFSVLLNSVQPVLTGVALGAGWQSVVAYVNIGCYYVIGIPLGILLGYLTSLEVKVEKASARLNKWLLPDASDSSNNNSHA